VRLADGASFARASPTSSARRRVGLVRALIGYTVIRTLEWQSRIHATLERA
jgi:hypothetical protein